MRELGITYTAEEQETIAARRKAYEDFWAKLSAALEEIDNAVDDANKDAPRG